MHTQLNRRSLQKRILFGVFIFIYSVFTFAMEGVSSSGEEVPYEQLVRELNTRVHRQERKIEQTIDGDPFERLQIHTSLGFVQSFSTLNILGQTTGRLEDGVQLGIGIDLFSPEWVAEGILKNFGRTKQDDSSLSLREFDLRLGYLQQAPQNKMRVRFVNGLGARNIRYLQYADSLSIHETTPIYLLGVGFIMPVGNHFDLDFEVQGHLSLISETIDRNGLNFIMRLNNVF